MATEKTYRFTLSVCGGDPESDRVADELYEAGCDDALVLVRGGRLYVDFDRTAPSFAEAVASAIAQVEGTPSGFKVLRIDREEP